MKTALLIAKGISAERANAVLEANDDIVSINDGCKLLPDSLVRYVFFAHASVYQLLEPHQHNVEQFVSRKLSDADMQSMPQWMRSKHTTYEDFDCDGDLEALTQRVTFGGIMHHHTTPAAIHWLAKYGKYEKLRIVGVDGGIKYADGLAASHPGCHDLDVFKQVTKRVAEICGRIYGLQVEWHS
jgi:hypothetical protein